MSSEHSVLLGVDLGTSAVKVLACGPDGGSIASSSVNYGLSTPQPGYVEQDAETVYSAAMRALDIVTSEIRVRSDEIVAVGLSSAMHSVLPVDVRGEPLAPLITWMDRRSAEVAEQWRRDGTAATLYAHTGAPVHPMLPSCKLRWLATHDRDLFEQVARFVGLKEFLVHCWTGSWLVDWGIASATGLFDPSRKQWDATALAAAGVEPERLSVPMPTSHAERNVRAPIAHALGLENASVVLASSDGALANLGVGAVRADEPALTLGTSGAIRVVFEHPELDDAGRTFCYAFDDARYIVGGPTSSAGAVLNKIFGLVLSNVPQPQRFEHAAALAETSPEGANGLVLAPFLSGERAPYWLSELRGALIGLDIAHTAADIARASFESVVFALATVRDVLGERLRQPKRIRLSGGLTRAPLVRRLVADVFGCEVVRCEPDEASAFGAAMMAGIAVGVVPGEAAVAGRLRTIDVEQPDAGRVEKYAQIYGRYRACVDAILPLFNSQ